jgi:hypothetical protein
MERFVDEPPRFKVAVANRPGVRLANRDQDVKRQVGCLLGTKFSTGCAWVRKSVEDIPGLRRGLPRVQPSQDC